MLILVLSLLLSVEVAYASPNSPGGRGTTQDFSPLAFSHPMTGTPRTQRRNFQVGNSFFRNPWVAGPSSTPLRDGLGPVYNAVSCAACHIRDGRGPGLPEKDGKVLASLLFRFKYLKSFGQYVDHPNYGGQLQPQGIAGVPAEGQGYVKFKDIKGKFKDGEEYTLKKPIYHFTELKFGELDNRTSVSPRVAPHLVGVGLIDSISDKSILEYEDQNDLDKNGISGRPNIIESKVNPNRLVGRFGWRAEKSTLKEQNAAAFNGDIGITSDLNPIEDCPDIQIECNSIYSEKTVELEEKILNRVTTYTKFLSVPARRNPSGKKVLRGEKVFKQISCQNCHRPKYTTELNNEHPLLSEQEIYPYSDFLLHDMGEELADVNAAGAETLREWKTPPLWGLGLVKVVNKHQRLMHDGRARNYNEAILWHGGEASSSREKYLGLSKNDREALIEFLEDL